MVGAPVNALDDDIGGPSELVVQPAHDQPTEHRVDRLSTSVVNADCRSWDIPNLWVCDGSIFPTTGGVNPSLTIISIAMRTVDRIRMLAKRGEL